MCIRDRIRKLMVTEGYYSPQIDSHIEKQNDTTRIRFRIETGERIRVGSVDLVFKGAIATQNASVKPNQTQLRNSWTLSNGLIFRHQDWEAAKIGLLQQVKARYPKASFVETQATVNPDLRKVSLKVVIDSGETVRFGEIRVDGLK